MPEKKTTSRASASKPAAKKPTTATQKEHSHAALEASVAALQKEVAALKQQCSSCCSSLDELRSQGSSSDPRVDTILRGISANFAFQNFRKWLKKADLK